MKQKDDNFTTDMFTRRGVGRPRKLDAKSQAQRAKEYRARKKQEKFNFLEGKKNGF